MNTNILYVHWSYMCCVYTIKVQNNEMAITVTIYLNIALPISVLSTTAKWDNFNHFNNFWLIFQLVVMRKSIFYWKIWWGKFQDSQNLGFSVFEYKRGSTPAFSSEPMSQSLLEMAIIISSLIWTNMKLVESVWQTQK